MADMTAAPSSPPPSSAPAGPSWGALWAKAAILALETALVVAVAGTTIASIPEHLVGYQGTSVGKLLLFFAMVAAIFWTDVLGHREAYRRAAVPRSAWLWNLPVFLLLMACLVWVETGAAGTAVGRQPSLLLLLVLLAAWLATAIVLWVPGLRHVPAVVGRLAFAFAVLLFARGAGYVVATYWRVTSEPTLKLVELLLTPFAGDVVIRPEPLVIGTPGFRVQVLAPCSGSSGIGLITGLLAGYLWWFRDVHRFPQSFLLFPIGIVLSYLANIVRITALILVGIWISPDIAVDGFHSQAGWIMFLLVGTGLIYGARRSGFFARRDMLAGAAGRSDAVAAAGESLGTSAEHPPSAVACLLPFLVLGASGMLTAAFTSGFPLLYPLRVVAVAVVLWRLRKHFPPLVETGLVSPGAIGIGACTFALWMALVPGDGAADPEKVAALDPAILGEPWGTLWLLFRVAGYTITVPIAEELAFRGFLMRRCIDEDVERVPVGTFTWPSFLLSSLAFGLLHWPSWIAGTMAGVAFALALYQRRRLADAIAAHATTNALLSVWVIGTGTWNGWG